VVLFNSALGLGHLVCETAWCLRSEDDTTTRRGRLLQFWTLVAVSHLAVSLGLPYASELRFAVSIAGLLGLERTGSIVEVAFRRFVEPVLEATRPAVVPTLTRAGHATAHLASVACRSAVVGASHGAVAISADADAIRRFADAIEALAIAVRKERRQQEAAGLALGTETERDAAGEAPAPVGPPVPTPLADAARIFSPPAADRACHRPFRRPARGRRTLDPSAAAAPSPRRAADPADVQQAVAAVGLDVLFSPPGAATLRRRYKRAQEPLSELGPEENSADALQGSLVSDAKALRRAGDSDPVVAWLADGVLPPPVSAFGRAVGKFVHMVQDRVDPTSSSQEASGLRL